MLTHLRIRDFILIDHLELAFQAGLTVLTGETGAGKSILLDAVEAVLGAKIPPSVIRPGATKAVLEATFRASDLVQTWLVEQELDAAEEIIISREISIRSNRYRLNGLVVQQQTIMALRDLLIDVTAQGQALTLSRTEAQRQLLDSFAQADEHLKTVHEHYKIWRQSQERLEQALTQQQTDQSQKELLRQQYQELKQARLTDPQEEDTLLSEQEILSHTAELTQISQNIYSSLYRDSASISDQLNQVNRLFNQISSYDPQILPYQEMIQQAIVEVDECARQVNRYSEHLEADPERLGQVESRLRLIQKLCKKYGPTLTEVIAFQQQIQTQWQQLKAGNLPLEDLKVQLEQSYQALSTSCSQLSQIRQVGAERLEQKIMASLNQLGMNKARFQVQLTPIKPTAEGQEQVNFLLAANPGQPLALLKNVASGGEMSRFLLALKGCLGEAIPTLIFDEIDAGVSGKVAQAVATHLFELSEHHQVLCVTHQPLVAALADVHWRVRKVSSLDQTQVEIDPLLTTAERTAELAQLAGGNSAIQAQEFVTALLSEARNLRHRKNL